MPPSPSPLTATKKYAAGALFALALHQAQIHQSQPLGFPEDDGGADCRPSVERISTSSSESAADDPQMWTHDSPGLLRLVFKYLEIDSRVWEGLELTESYSTTTHHIGAVTAEYGKGCFIRLLSKESSDGSEESAERELALANSVKAMCLSLGDTREDHQSKKEKATRIFIIF